jgi:hypothetical protein
MWSPWPSVADAASSPSHWCAQAEPRPPGIPGHLRSSAHRRREGCQGSSRAARDERCCVAPLAACSPAPIMHIMSHTPGRVTSGCAVAGVLDTRRTSASGTACAQRSMRRPGGTSWNRPRSSSPWQPAQPRRRTGHVHSDALPHCPLPYGVARHGSRHPVGTLMKGDSCDTSQSLQSRS